VRLSSTRPRERFTPGVLCCSHRTSACRGAQRGWSVARARPFRALDAAEGAALKALGGTGSGVPRLQQWQLRGTRERGERFVVA